MDPHQQQQPPPYVYQNNHHHHYNPHHDQHHHHEHHHDPLHHHDPNPEVTPERVPLLLPAPPPPAYDAEYHHDNDHDPSPPPAGPPLPPLPTNLRASSSPNPPPTIRRGGGNYSPNPPTNSKKKSSSRPPNHSHSRTRSVDFQQHQQSPTYPSSPGRKMAPQRHHQRTRSLEEWANMFGITGITGGIDDIVHERTDLKKKRIQMEQQQQQEQQRGTTNGYTFAPINGYNNAFPIIRPPLAPKAPPFASPSSVNRKQHRRLDSIVEQDQVEEEEENDDSNSGSAAAAEQKQQLGNDSCHHGSSSDHSRRRRHHRRKNSQQQNEQQRSSQQQPGQDDNEEDVEAPEIYDGGRAAFAAAALGGFGGINSGQQNLSDGSQHSHVIVHLPNEPYQPPPSPRFFLKAPSSSSSSPSPRLQPPSPLIGGPPPTSSSSPAAASLLPPLPLLGRQQQQHQQQQEEQHPSPGETLSPNDDNNHNNINNYSSYDAQSMGSNDDGSSSLFSIPQQLTSGSGQYSSFSGTADAGGGDTGVGEEEEDDSSVEDDNSTTLDFSKSQSPASSSYHHHQEYGVEDGCGYNSSNTHDTNNTNHTNNLNNTPNERLAKFEKEQQIMFQQRKSIMERELSNVLERNAVKSHREKQEFINTYIQELEKERAKLVAQWKEEWENAEREEEYLKQIRDPNRRLLRELNQKIGSCLDSFLNIMSNVEVFISNMPLTIAALALSWVSMGCVWFKFMEENVDSCSHVHFYSPHCTFPEFPGCFECDVTNRWYIIGVNWHYFCSIVSFTFCSMIILKVIIAWDVVVDELSNPTTSTPCGVFCIAMVCVFAGRGPIGEMVVLITATFHFMLAFFFLYRALYKYRLYPDPGWFPNTVGISYAAVKSFLYFPVYGEILMSICLTFFFGVFFISALRVATNPKIAAPICWFMISAPSITLYAVTLIPQPGLSEENAMEHNPQLKAHFVNFLQHYFLPLHHFLFGCSLIGVCSAIHGVMSRWEKFKEKPFSPAHVAFVAPTLSHTNAIQAYRGTVAALSSFPPGGKFRTAIYIYWCIFLFTGTIVNFIFTYKFLSRLPEWTKVDISGEHEQPPAPNETMTHEMLDDRGAHETMLSQPFVSPAVLEANEAGALIRVRRGTEDYRRYGPFIRTRKVTARGFDPSMNDTELREERAALLDWVAKNAPRKRNRTMSIPGVLHLRDQAGRDVYYGSFLGGGGGDGGNGQQHPPHSQQGSMGSFNSSADNPSDTSAAGRDSGGFISRSSSNSSSRRSSRHARARTSVDGFW